MINNHGQVAQTWLKGLDNFLAELVSSYRLELLAPFTTQNYNWVLKVGFDKKPCVLKLSPPNKEFSSEVQALENFSGQSAVKIYVSDVHKGFMIQEQLEPGVMLKEVEDEDKAIEIAANVMLNLWTTPKQSDSFPSIEDWLNGFERYQSNHSNWGELESSLCEAATDLSQQLLQTQAKQILLHGDLHHENILSCHDGFKAIDPKGILGEPLYEVGAFIRNPYPDIATNPNLKKILKHRAMSFAHLLKASELRIVQWSFVQAMLSAIWSIEEGQIVDAQSMTNIARILYELANP